MKLSSTILRALALTAGLLAPMVSSYASAQNSQGTQPQALVISNQRYEEGTRLRNILIDGRDIAAELQALGYGVSRVENADAERMVTAISAFLEQSIDASQRLVYFGGLSLSIDGETFLAATDAKIDQAFDIVTDFVSLSDLVLTLQAGDAPGIAIINAGFSNSFDEQVTALFGDELDDISDSLGQPSGSEDVFVLQSQTAGIPTPKGRTNTQFVDQLLNSLLRDSETPIERAAQAIAAQVASDTNSRQVPQASQGFSLGTSLAGIDLTPSIDPVELAAFESALAANSVVALDDFIRDFPASSFLAEAQDTRSAKLRELGFRAAEKPAITRRTANTRTGPSTNFAIVDQLNGGVRLTELGRVNRGVWAYVQFDTGQTAFIYGTLIEAFDVQEYEDWQAISGGSSLTAVQSFLSQYPNGRYASQAQSQLSDLLAQQRLEELNRLRITPIGEVYYVGEQAKVFDYPASDASTLGRFEPLQKLTVIGKVRRRDWYEVAIAQGRGFMQTSDLLEFAGSDFEAWEGVKDSTRVRALERFLRSYPNSRFADQARARIEELRPRIIIKPINVEYYTDRVMNLRAGPSGENDVVTRLKPYTPVLAVGEVQGAQWVKVQADAKGRAYEGFMFEPLIKRYEGSDFQAWERAKDVNSPRAYRRFLSNFPQSAFTEQAQERLDELGRPSLPEGYKPDPSQVYVMAPTGLKERASNRSQTVLEISANSVFDRIALSQNNRWAYVTVKRGGQLIAGYVRARSLIEFRGSDLQAWRQARQADTKPAYQAYLNAHPDGAFVARANEAIKKFVAKPIPRIKALPPQKFTVKTDWAIGYAKPIETSKRIRQWRSQDVVVVDGKSSDEKFYRTKVDNQVVFILVSDTEDYNKSERGNWDRVVKRNSKEGWQFYLRTFPKGRWAAEARKRLQNQRDQGLQLFLKLGEEIISNQK